MSEDMKEETSLGSEGDSKSGAAIYPSMPQNNILDS